MLKYTSCFLFFLCVILIPTEAFSYNAYSSNIDFLNSIFASEANVGNGRSVYLKNSLFERDTISIDSVKNKKENLLEAAIDYSCDDTITFSLLKQKVFLRNNAFVKYGSIELKAHYIELDLLKKEAYAYGIADSTGNMINTPEFKDGAEEFSSKEMRYNFKSGKGLVKEVITEQEGGYIHSELTKRIDDKIFYLKDGKYTTCDHEHPHFYIKLSKAKMIKDDKIISGPLHIVLEDVPLPIGLPFGFFPFSSSYSSGIVLPSYGDEQQRGFNLRGGGYYFAFNEYLDLKLTGDIFTNGSWGTYIESNYKSRYKFSGSLSVDYHANKYGDKGLPDYTESKDFGIRWTHRQDAKANPYRTFSASVNFSTTQNDRNNSRNMRDIVNNTKQSSISYSKRWPGSPFSLSSTLRHSQNSRDSTISLSLPDVSFSMTQIYPFRAKGKSSNLKWWDKIGVSYSSSLKNSIKIKEDKLFKSSLVKDWQNGFQHRIPVTTSFKITRDITLSPSLNYKGMLYGHSIRKRWDPSVGDTGGVIADTIRKLHYAHNYSTGLSLGFNPKVYGMFTFSEKSKLMAIRHVMSPSVSFSYTPEIGVDRSKYYKSYFDANSGREVEYSIFEGSVYGTPLGAQEAGSINLSLDNNLEAKIKTSNDTTGNESVKKLKLLESLRFSTSYNVFKDSLNWSNLAITGSTRMFNDKLNVNFSSSINPYDLNDKNQMINSIRPRLTNASITTGFSLSSKDFQSDATEDSDDDINKNARYVDFDIPWSLSVDYSWRYSKNTTKVNINQNVSMRGNFSLTPKWKFNLSTSYDIKNKDITATSLGITRDLHCWQMSINTIPFGKYQSYNITINVKSSILQDLKYEKRDSWQDNYYR